MDNLVHQQPSDQSLYDDKSANLMRQIVQDDISKSLGHGLILIDHSYCRKVDYELPLSVHAAASEVSIANTSERQSSVANYAENELPLIVVENEFLVAPVSEESLRTVAKAVSSAAVKKTESSITVTKDKISETCAGNKLSETHTGNESLESHAEVKLSETIAENEILVTAGNSESLLTVTKTQSKVSCVGSLSTEACEEHQPATTQDSGQPAETKDSERSAETSAISFETSKSVRICGESKYSGFQEKSEYSGIKKEIQSAEAPSQSTETEGQSPETEGQSPETEGQSPKTEGQSPETEGQSPETEGQSPETEGQSPETEGQSTETEGQSVETRKDQSFETQKGQSTENPAGQSTEAPEGRSAETPEGQSAETPEGQSAETPEGQSAETPEGQSAETPEGQFAETPEGQSAETPVNQSTDTPVGQCTVTPEVRATENPESQSTENPESQSTENPESQSTENPESQSTENPESQSTENAESQFIENSESQSTETPEGRSVEVLESQFTEVPESHSTEIPESHSTEIPESQPTEIPERQFAEIPENLQISHSTEVPEGQSTEVPERQSAEIPKGQSLESPEDQILEDSQLSETAESQSVETASSQLIATVKSRLVETAKSQLVEITKGQLVEIAENQLIETGERQLVETVKSQPAETVKSQPAETLQSDQYIGASQPIRVTEVCKETLSPTSCIESQLLSICVESTFLRAVSDTQYSGVGAENQSLKTHLESRFSDIVEESKSSAVVGSKASGAIVVSESTAEIKTSVVQNSENRSPVKHSPETPRRRSQRQIEKICREESEKQKASSVEVPLEETHLNNVQLFEASSSLADVKCENIAKENDVTGGFIKQVQESRSMSKKHRNSGTQSKSSTNIDHAQSVAKSPKQIASAQRQNKNIKKDTLTDSEDVKERAKVIDSENTKAFAVRSKTARKSLELETVDDCEMPSSNCIKNMSIKRRTSDSFSSTSSEMSMSPTKTSTPKKKKLAKNLEEMKSLTSSSTARRDSLPSKKLSNSKEMDEKTNGLTNKQRTKSFSEDKKELGSVKKLHLSSEKELLPTQFSVTKPKVNKPKKRVFKNDPLSLDLLGPVLFSQPHVMGKQKSEEILETKENPNSSAIKPSDLPVKSEGTVHIKSESNVIKTETDAIDSKCKDLASSLSLEKTAQSSKLDRSIEVKIEIPKTKSHFSDSKPIENSSVIPTAVEKVKPKTVVPSVKIETESIVQTPKIAKLVTKERKTSISEKNTEPTTKPLKPSAKVDATWEPERKSQRNVQKRKRIYEDDSDFEETLITVEKPAVNSENDSRDSLKRSQRQRSVIKITDLSDYESDSDDSDYNVEAEKIQKSDVESGRESDANDGDESGEEEEEDVDEDDPNKLWCLCRQPHNNKFMICCDKCEDWFHGTCVGITRKMGQILEDEKKEWICPNCKKGITKMPEKRSHAAGKDKKQETATQAAVVKKATQAAVKQTNKPPVKQSAVLVSKTRVVQENGREKQKTDTKSNELIEQCLPKTLPESNNTKPHLLKKIDQRKEIVLMKRDPRSKKSSPQKQTSSQRGLPKKEGSPEKLTRGNVSPLKALTNKETASGKVPSATEEKPIVVRDKHSDSKANKTTVSSNTRNAVKSTTNRSLSPEKSSDRSTKRRTSSVSNDCTPKTKAVKDRGKQKMDCIVCSKPVPLGSVYCGQQCLEKYTTESLTLILNQNGFLKDNEDWKTKRIVVIDRQNGTLITGSNAPALGEIVSWLRSNPSFEIVRPSTSVLKKDTSQKLEGKLQTSATVDEREDSSTEAIRKNVRNSLKIKLTDRCKNSDDFEMAEDAIKKIATKIEEELHSHLKDMSRYMKKYRSLIFNIQDSRNMGLFRKILSGEIAPDHLVKMSTDELAAPELAQWRAKENQHSLDMIKRMQVDNRTSAGVRKKTHKGEIEIEDELTVREPEIDKPVIATPPRLTVETIEISPETTDKKSEKKKDNDTTASHRSHLFDLNCKICTGKIAPPPIDEPAVKKVRVAHSISVEQSSPKSFSSMERLVSPITPGPASLFIAAEASDDSVDREPTSTTHSSPDSSTVQLQQIPNRKKSQFSVWKGFVEMQDVAKFYTNAYKVSGPTDFLPEDIPDIIQVCGRIVPDQVWDYLSKIKQSGNKELTVIRFQAVSGEDQNSQYNHFYTYLYTRKRYGVVGSSSKMIKDFYIFPLAAHNPVPTVLMPFDGPGLPSNRPHMLLGILVRHRIKQSISGTPIEIDLEEDIDNEGSFTPPLEARSYTPPLVSRSYTPPLPSVTSLDQGEVSSTLPLYFSSKNEASYPAAVDASSLKKRFNEEYNPYEPSYTPPQRKMQKTESSDDNEKPYDPEQDCHSTQSIHSDLSDAPSTPVVFTQLLKKNTDNNVATTNSTVTDDIPDSSYMQQQRLLLDALTQEGQKADHKVTSLETELEVQSLEDDSQGSSSLVNSIVIPSINASGMSSFLDLPQNLQEILNFVHIKPREHDSPTESGKKDIDQRCLPAETKRDVDFRSLTQSKKDEDTRQLPSYSPIAQNSAFSEEPTSDIDDREEDSSQGATPPPVCEDDDNSSPELRPSDPRIKLRTNFVEFASEETRKVSLSDMSTRELMERAQKELETIPSTESQSDVTPSSVSADGITMEHYHLKGWSQYTEPPPPGIDPSELPPVENVAFPTTKPETLYISPPENHAIIPPFPPPPSATAAVPGFSVPIPPPGYPLSTPPPTVDGHKLFPPPPPGAILPPTFLPPPPIPPPGMVAPPMEAIDPADERYHLWPPDGPPSDSNWRENTRRWREREWEDRPYRQSQQERHHDQDDFHRRRYQRDYYHDDYREEVSSQDWQEEDREAHFERNEPRRWNHRSFRDRRRNDNFRGRKNFRRPRE